MNIKKYNNIYNITAKSFEKYLTLNGWGRNYDFPNKNLMVFEYEGQQMVLPASEKYNDFYMVLADMVEEVSICLNKPVQEVIKEINTAYYDWLEFRIISKSSEAGRLPLGYATECIEGLKELVLYAACAEQNVEPICIRTTNNAKEILNNFELAQTEMGSFVINIDIQVVDENDEQFFLEVCDAPKQPMEHLVVKRIGKALDQVNEIVENNAKMDTAVTEAYKTGITANMCEALLKLKPQDEDMQIDTKIRYASAISRKASESSNITINPVHFYVLDELSKRYRKTVEPENIHLTKKVR